MVGLVALALMNPQTTGPDFCLLEFLGYSYCPGEGLGHSIAYLFRGQLDSAIEANIMGPFAVGMLSLRIIYQIKRLIKDIFQNRIIQKEEETDGKIN